MSFIGKYEGSCENCGQETKGSRVTYVGFGEVAHVTCPTPAEMCPRCFLELPVTGVCDNCG